MSNLEETFEYDSQNRLKKVWLGPTLTGASVYDSYGRMTAKTANGQLIFYDAEFGTTAKPHAMDAATTVAENFPQVTQTITYTGFDKVSKVKQGNDSLCYTYGYDHQRILMEEHVGNRHRTKRYVGNCEYITKTNGNDTEEQWLTYLTGSTGIYAVVMTKSGRSQMFYVLKDNLGSWTTITDENGEVEQRLNYDAWGNLRNPNYWTGFFSGVPMFDRGFTGHEHLTSFGLINMNGRIYDPVMSSFLSVDQYVSSPENAQGFNRYAYCMNNPLRFVDPTGWEPRPGGGNGDGPYLPGAPYYVDGMLTVDLPEIIIMPDNPSLSNRKEAVTYNTYYYGGERLNLSWTSNSEGQSVGPNSGGCGGGSGNHGGRQSMDIAAGVLATMWGVSVVEPTPAGEVVTGVASIAATIYYGKELYDKMKAEITHLLTRPDGLDGFIWKIGETTQGKNRYSDKWYQTNNVRMIPVFYGNQREIKIQEKILIYNYYIQHGHLPPGNKIFR